MSMSDAIEKKKKKKAMNIRWEKTYSNGIEGRQ